jgi:hypothetical protein
MFMLYCTDINIKGYKNRFFYLFIIVVTSYNIMKEYKNKEDNIRIRIDSGLKNRYQEYCDENGFSISKRIRLLLEKDLRGELKTVNNYDN